MNIVVLNGSPKGEVSVTMQYLQKKFPKLTANCKTWRKTWPGSRRGITPTRWRTRLQNALVTPLPALPRFRAEYQKGTKQGMIAPLKKIVEGA